jgi:HNH endonuclease
MACGSLCCRDADCSVAFGLCHCGCGEQAPNADRTHTQFHWYKGNPKRFIKGHGLIGAKHPNWTGGKFHYKGYILIYVGRDHPMANKNGRCYEHRLVVAEREGRMLERHEHIHHRNGIRDDNRSENLELIDPVTHTRLKSKLTEDDVREIWEGIEGGESDSTIARLFDVSPAAIWKIRKGETWKQVR